MNGYKGLIYSDYRMLSAKDFSGILTQGGTILGTSRQPFKLMRTPDANGLDKVEAMKHTYHKLLLDCLVILGGNGTQKTANLLREEGLNIIHLPKTIDNDIYGTDMTFGFYSAVNIASDAIDCIHTTASSHQRVFIVEVMGHKVGWLTLYAGIASGADVILIPEIPYDIEKVCEAINRRKERGSGFTILAVAEGAIAKEDAALPKKELKKRQEEIAKKYPSVSYKIAEEIEAKTGMEIRVTVPGHMQRGGSPCPYDRVLATRLGAAAADLILKEDYGYMVGIKNGNIRDGQITGSKMADQSIPGSKLNNKTITGAQIAEGSITNEEILDYTIDASMKMVPSSVDESCIATSAVGSRQLQVAAVNTAAIMNKAITLEKLADKISVLLPNTVTNIAHNISGTQTFPEGTIGALKIPPQPSNHETIVYLVQSSSELLVHHWTMLVFKDDKGPFQITFSGGTTISILSFDLPQYAINCILDIYFYPPYGLVVGAAQPNFIVK